MITNIERKVFFAALSETFMQKLTCIRIVYILCYGTFLKISVIRVKKVFEM